MKLNSFNDLFVDCIKDLYSAENQLIKGLTKMAKKATTPELKQSFEKHLAETEVQKERLDQIAELLEINPKGKKCAAMEGLLAEVAELLEEIKDKDVLDAALIGAAQKVEHYEIASYGTASTYAKLLNNEEVLNLLLQTLEEEKATDLILTDLAKSVVNEKAANVEK